MTAGNRETQLYYDPLGRLYRILDDDTGETNFVYDGNELVAEYDGSGQMLRRYVHGASATADDPLVWYEGDAMNSTTRRYIHADPRGSIVSVTDYKGHSVATNSYDEYGIPDLATQNSNDIATRGRFRYTGQAWLPELDMYYYKARIYSPTLGRFLQTDPIGYEDQYNLYAYVRNDPINGIDPTGLYSCEGNAKQCERFEAGLQTLRDSASGSKRTGSNLIVKDRRLNAALDFIGTDNGKGPTITFEKESGQALASYGGNNINLDLGKINAAADGVQASNGIGAMKAQNTVIAGVLAHEGIHGTSSGFYGSGARGQYLEEHEAYGAELNVYRQLGLIGRFAFGDIPELAYSSCTETSFRIGDKSPNSAAANQRSVNYFQACQSAHDNR